MSALRAETAATLRRLVRRRSSRLLAAGNALALTYLVFRAPPGAASGALAAATALGGLSVLVLTAGLIADDRWEGRLVAPGTHPAARWTWLVGRWLAVMSLLAPAYTLGCGIALAGTAALPAPPALVAAWLAGLLHLAALAALSVALSVSCRPSTQLLCAVAVLVAGAMPPEIVALRWSAPAATDVIRVAWSVLPTPWASTMLRAWALEAGPAAPLLALLGLAQVAAWLTLGSRALARAELGARGV